MTLAEAAALADELAKQGKEREVADLRRDWADELELEVRSQDYRERATAYRAIGQRGLGHESSAARGRVAGPT